MKRRVVITGIGCLTPVGRDLRTTWENLLRGVSGIGYATLLDLSTFPSKILGEVKGFDIRDYFSDERVTRFTNRHHQLTLAAARMAVEDAGLDQVIGRYGPAAVGVGVGVGAPYPELSHMQYLLEFSKDRQWDFDAFAAQAQIPAESLFQRSTYTLSGLIAKLWQAAGPNYLVQTACASAGYAIGQAYRLIRAGTVRAMITGGGDAISSHIQLASFTMLGALSTRKTEPAKASRPFDGERDGFVFAEGGGMLVLEDLESALERGATIYGEIAGYGSSSNAFRVTDFPEDGLGPRLAMERALRDAEIGPGAIDYICAHGTSTTQNDIAETTAIKHVFGDNAYRIPVSSIKSCIGHLISGAGGVNAIAAIMATRENRIPPTINLEYPDPCCDLDYVPNKMREKEVRCVLSNAFGFGGQNACLIFKKYEDGLN